MIDSSVDPGSRLLGALPPPEGLPVFVPNGKWGMEARDMLQGVRAVLYERHRAGASGEEIVRDYTGAVDHIITTLYAAASTDYAERHNRLDQRLTVIAQGGYG